LVVLAGRREELDTAAALSFNPPKVLALAADDKPNQTRLDINRLDVILLAS
jgi:hypothetical protein